MRRDLQSSDEPHTGGGKTIGKPYVSKITSLSGEYLFFIAATYLALLLISRRRWFSALAAFAAGTLWMTFHLPVSMYLSSLGPDSFAETRGFNLHEALFWFYSMREAVHPMFSLKKFAVYLAVAVVSFYALRYLLSRKASLSPRVHAVVTVSVATVAVILAVYGTTAQAVAAYLDNTELFKITEKNFRNEPPLLKVDADGPNLVVYIGESTTVMNMGLYGYPRDTTPGLSRMARDDGNLLVFHNTFSTHSHTSRSLLEALSFGLDSSEYLLPIERRRRVPVVDVLKKAGLAPRLVSNQGMGGAWDHTASVIFRQSDNSIRVKEVGSKAGASAPRWDDEYFAAELDKQAQQGPRKLTFLHSYAGHGPYFENIPERFRAPVDLTLRDMPPRQVLENPSLSITSVEEYDSAVRYVDHSVATAIDRVRRWPQPTILVYFSDHGDAAFGNRGHDSARFSHEMGRVPLLVYFNDAARTARPALFAKYQKLAAGREMSTLAQLPSTLLDLLGVRVSGAARPALVTTPVFGEKIQPQPVMIRESGDAVTAVNLSLQPLPKVNPQGQRVIDRTDDDTRRFVAIRSGQVKPAEICAKQPANFEVMSRNIIIAGCQYSRLATQ